jgi:NADPH:quinone reductase-like Zn-dependent oxidoreductase
MGQVLQSGSVTPGHVATWTTDGVIEDGGVAVPNLYALYVTTITAVNFNQINFDNQILINLPAGYTRWRCDRVLISGASGSISTATAGLFTATGAGGTQIVSSGSAITVVSSSIDTNNNMQSMTITDQNTMALSDTAVYWRNQVAEGSAQTANVSVYYEVLP